jgi:hypothetical protein
MEWYDLAFGWWAGNMMIAGTVIGIAIGISWASDVYYWARRKLRGG